MKKAIACLLALPLALAACGVQNVPAQTAQPTDTPVETPAPTTASTAPSIYAQQGKCRNHAAFSTLKTIKHPL